MRRAMAIGGVLAVGAWSVGAGVLATGVQETTRTVYVSVFDEDGQQVHGVTPEDLTLEEGGDEYEITSVAYPSARMHLTIMVEEIVAPDTNVRVGVYEMAKRMLPQADVGLVLVGNRAETVVEHTTDINAIVEALNDFTMRQTRTAGNVAEAVYSVARQIEEAAPERPAIVTVALEAMQTSTEQPDHVLDQIRKSRAVFHTVTIQAGAINVGAGMLGEMAARSQILGDGPRQSGGRRIELRNTNGVADALKEISDELSAQYLLTYVLPDGVDPDRRLDVSIDRSGAELRAPSRIAD